MTLNTKIYVHGPVDHRLLFARCNQLIGATEATRCEDKQDSHYQDGDWITAPDSPWTLSNEPDQGLPGWLFVHYRPGAALRTPAQAAEHDPDCDGEDDCTWNHRPACWASVALDTAYSYSDEYGGCGDLHARFVTALGAWLDERDVRWQWVNEFTGEAHWGYEGVDELGSGGAEARNWLVGTVLPAIGGALSE